MPSDLHEPIAAQPVDTIEHRLDVLIERVVNLENAVSQMAAFLEGLHRGRNLPP